MVSLEEAFYSNDILLGSSRDLDQEGSASNYSDDDDTYADYYDIYDAGGLILVL